MKNLSMPWKSLPSSYIKYFEKKIISNTHPAGYANTPDVEDTSNPALLQTVNPITFLSFI